MIKKIIHVSDIHIRNFLRMEEYGEQLTKFIELCKQIAEPYKREEIRIVITGDLIHQKNTISPELFAFTSTFIRQLEEIANVIVIAGNHDLVVNNTSRKDAITSLFETASFDNSFLLDYELDYKSGYVIDDNVTWALYSIYDDFQKPNIEQARAECPSNKVIGLYHGEIVGSTLNNGTVVDYGLNRDAFDGCDCAMIGHIHKRQCIKNGDIDILYPGSLIQQDYGETVTQHGFAVWDVETMEYEFVDLPTDYGIYKFEIKSFDDIDNDKEILVNY